MSKLTEELDIVSAHAAAEITQAGIANAKQMIIDRSKPVLRTLGSMIREEAALGRLSVEMHEDMVRTKLFGEDDELNLEVMETVCLELRGLGYNVEWKKAGENEKFGSTRVQGRILRIKWGIES